jgi:hypothetical protein
VTLPSCVNLTAFDSRLSSTCFSFVRSVCSGGRSSPTSIAVVQPFDAASAAATRRSRDQLGDVRRLEVQRHLAGLDLRQVEDVVDQVEQVLAGV